MAGLCKLPAPDSCCLVPRWKSSRAAAVISWLAGCLALILILGSGSVWAQSTSVLEWGYTSNANATLKHLGVSTSTVNMQALTGISGFSGTVTGGYYQVGSWTNAATTSLYSPSPTSTTPQAGVKQIYSTFTLKNPVYGDWSSMAVSLRYYRSATSAPQAVRAMLTWNEGGTWKTRYSASTATTVNTTWTTLSLPLNTGSTAPASSALSGTTFLLVLQFYTVSNTTNNIQVDDIKFLVNSLSANDYGDWNGSGAATSTTSSIANSTLRLGTTVDAEVTPATAADASSDDGANTGSADDEDGVTMPSSITTGSSVTIPVSVFNNNTSGKYLQAWIDFNNDGTFNNTDVSSGGERIYNAVTTASASQQTINVTFTVPAGASLGTQRGARFRISDNAATTPTSSGANGEIEDYIVTIAAPPRDYGDWAHATNTTGAATTSTYSLVNSNLRLGATIDSEASVTPTSLATADGADEDGVTLPTAPWTVGQAQNFAIVVTNNTGSDSYLRAWIDYNNDGDFNDYGELVITDVVSSGTTNSTRYYAVSPLAAGTNLGVRVRLSSDSGVTATSSVGSGEIEDYVTTITAVTNTQCYSWTGDNVNENWDFDTGELTPAAVSWTPHINGESFGPIRYIKMSYNPTSKVLEGFARIKCYSASRPLQGAWFVLSDGPFPRANNRAIVYYDGYTPTQPKMSVYVYDETQSDNSWSTPGKLLATSVNDTRIRPGPIINEGSNYYTFQFSIDASVINDGTNFPSYNLPQDWQGIRFGSEVGVWLHWFMFSGQPTYNASGALTAFPIDQTTLDTAGQYKNFIAWFDTGYWPALLKANLGTKTADFGDYALFPSASSNVLSTLKIGSTVDPDDGIAANLEATADDLNNTGSADDEDGVTVPTGLQVGGSGNLTVNVTNTTGSTAYLNAWIDFNGNGVLTDAGEQIKTNLSITGSTSNANQTLAFTIPATAAIGQVGVRVRLTSVSSPGPDGADGNGEVEDHVLNIVNPNAFAVGNLVYIDANDNGRFDSGEGVNGVTVKLFPQGTATSGTPTATTTTTAVNGVNGCYSFTGLAAGSYYVHIPASNFASGQPLYGQYSMVGAGGDNGKDDDWDENGIDSPAPATNGISSNVFALSAGAEPTTSETGVNGSWDVGTSGKPADNNADMTIDFGFCPCDQTNLILNGSFETANPSNLTFPDSFPAGGAAIAKTRSTTSNTDIAGWTFDTGSYVNDATRATDGSRFVYLNGQGCAGQQFTVGLSQAGFTQLQTGKVYTLTFDWAPFDASAPNTPAAGNNTGIYTDLYYTDASWTNSTFVTSFHDYYEPKTNDFVVQPRPLSTWASLDWHRCRFKFNLPAPPAGQNYLTLFLTSNGTTPKVLIDNVKLTVSCDQNIGTVGNLVWNDANANGIKDASETGIDQVLVSLYRRPATGSPVLVGQTYTSQGGRYFFTGMLPANYFAWLPTENFSSSTPWWLSSGTGRLYNWLSSSGNASTTLRRFRMASIRPILR